MLGEGVPVRDPPHPHPPGSLEEHKQGAPQDSRRGLEPSLEERVVAQA